MTTRVQNLMILGNHTIRSHSVAILVVPLEYYCIVIINILLVEKSNFVNAVCKNDIYVNKIYYERPKRQVHKYCILQVFNKTVWKYFNLKLMQK